ncbi:MAG: glutamyl-tRNA reductase [Bacteroidota bacterium]
MHNYFKAISLSHKTASLEIRERVALNAESCKALLVQIKEITDISEILILSTCNRTEVYYSSPEDLSTVIIQLLSIQTGSLGQVATHHFALFNQHNDAVKHLFEVCLGLHSQVIGDMQIGNQVKHAYQWTADQGLAGPFLHRLMHTIFFTSKRVAQETRFRDGAASVSYAAVELLEELTLDIAQPKVLVVGLGEIGADVCKNLADKKIANITLTNRTAEKAEQLAQACNLRVASFDNLQQEMQQADVIISSVSKAEPLISQKMVEEMNVLTFKYFIDLSVPRSVEASVEEIPGVLVYNIDHIRNRATEALEKRIQAIPQVERIVTEAIEEFNDWSKEMGVSPTINKLKNALEQIRQEEMARHLKYLTTEETDRMDKITRSIMQKIIKLPVLQLKAACKRGEAETLIDVLNDLFDLEKQSARNSDLH